MTPHRCPRCGQDCECSHETFCIHFVQCGEIGKKKGANRIIEVKLTLVSESWLVEVTKEFAPEHGGGQQTFTEYGGVEIHEALRRAAYMVTLTPARRDGPQHLAELVDS
jgi:hypothetical protein